MWKIYLEEIMLEDYPEPRKWENKSHIIPVVTKMSLAWDPSFQK